MALNQFYHGYCFLVTWSNCTDLQKTAGWGRFFILSSACVDDVIETGKFLASCMPLWMRSPDWFTVNRYGLHLTLNPLITHHIITNISSNGQRWRNVSCSSVSHYNAVAFFYKQIETKYLFRLETLFLILDVHAYLRASPGLWSFPCHSVTTRLSLLILQGKVKPLHL